MLVLLFRIVINTISLVVAAYVVNSFSGAEGSGESVLAAGPIIIDSWRSALGAGLIFGLVNALIRPLLFFFTCLLQVITLGLFTLVLNAILLLLTSWFAGHFGVGFQVLNFAAAFWGALMVSIVSMLLTRVAK